MTNSELFILAGNGSYLNRGCEAIIRGTVGILRHHFNSPKFFVESFYSDKCGLSTQMERETDPDIVHDEARGCRNRFDYEWFMTNILRRTYPGALKHFFYGNLKPLLPLAKAVLAVGGDNYSIDYHGHPISCTSLDDLVISSGKPLIIWGASVGPFSKDPAYEKYIINHFRKVHIFARETHTLNYLNEQGLVDNVYRVADPAFLMDAVEPAKEKLDIAFDDGAIGINISPLLAQFNSGGNLDAWVAQAAMIVRSIITKTGRTVYLIPHTDTDYPFLCSVFSKLDEKNGRIFLVPDTLNAAEAKWVIGKMSLFAGARTHSTIASLSSCIPTLSFSYSIKSRGINQDVYGHTEYCLDTRSLSSEIVADKVLEMLSDSKKIGAQLRESIPQMREYALNSGDILKRILHA